MLPFFKNQLNGVYMGDKADLNVLIIEDDLDLLDLLADILSSHFSRIRKAPDAISAYLAFKDQQPDFVIADIKMAGMSGVEFVTRIRAEGFSTPVILCSSSPQMSDLKKALALGVVDFIEKPYTVESVETAVFRMIEIQSRTHNLNSLIATHGKDSPEVKRHQKVISLFQAANASRSFKQGS